MDLSTLYWVLILPNIGTFFTIISCLLIIGAGTIIVSSAMELDGYNVEEERKTKLRATRNKATKFLVVPMALLFVSVFVPSSKQMMYLIGGYAATNVEGVEKLPKNVVNAANAFLEQYTKQDTKK